MTNAELHTEKQENEIKDNSETSITFWRCYFRYEDGEFVVDIESTTSEVLRSPKNITLHVQSATSSYKYCVICKEHLSKAKKSCIIPLNARTQSFIKKGIFIVSQARCCLNHLTNKIFSDKALELLKSKYSKTLFNRTEIVTLLENVRKTFSLSSSVNLKICNYCLIVCVTV